VTNDDNNNDNNNMHIYILPLGMLLWKLSLFPVKGYVKYMSLEPKI